VNARLHPLREDEFDAWYAAVKSDYAERAGFARDRAQQNADAVLGRLVPARRVPDGHAVFVIEDGGEPVGRLCLAEREADGGPALFVYEVAVDEGARGLYRSVGCREVAVWMAKDL
jgi:hypothetical protein